MSVVNGCELWSIVRGVVSVSCVFNGNIGKASYSFRTLSALAPVGHLGVDCVCGLDVCSGRFSG